MDFSLAAILDQPKKYMSGNVTTQELRTKVSPCLGGSIKRYHPRNHVVGALVSVCEIWRDEAMSHKGGLHGNQ
jgi:hypothetical protein